MLGSFRDPSGFVFREEDGDLYRQVNRVYEPDYARLHASGLYEELTGERLLVRHDDVGLDKKRTADALAVIRPEPLPFVTYPYEWCFGQLKDAALLTLDVQTRALDHGMSLKDASAYNVMFRGVQPIFIDTLSFETYEEGKPWVAYRQFCRHFLAPLSLMALVDLRINGLIRNHIEGIPLDLASRMLPRSSWLRPGLALHLHIHAKAEQRHASKGVGTPGSGGAKKVTVSAMGLRGIIDSLESTIRKLSVKPGRSEWSSYYEDNTYSEGSSQHKAGTVQRYLGQVRPGMVWDLGANTGRYSEIAREYADCVIAMEQDPWCVEAAYRKWKDEGKAILPITVDLANPSPALGWAHAERQSLVDRGPADAVLALALIHHLCIANNVPLPEAAAFFAAISRNLIIEFVPKEDEMVQFLLQSREDIFPDYSQQGFEAAFTQRFEILDRAPAPESNRVLYLMKTK